jgi:peptide/nickel transport system substrate-binding protein
VQTFPHPARFYAGFNLRRRPFDDLRVRQAINMAINRTELVNRALLGYGAPGLGFYTPLIAWAYNAKAQVPAFDAASAERLLDEAGMPRGADGVRLKLALVTLNFSPFKEIAEALKEQLRGVGLEVEVVPLTPADWNKRIFQEHDFDLALTDGTHGPDPDNLDFRFGSKGLYNFTGYASAEFDAAVAEGARPTKSQERAQAYFRAQEILARDLPLAPLTENVQFIITRDNVTGLPQTEARGLVTFNDFSLVRVKR